MCVTVLINALLQTISILGKCITSDALFMQNNKHKDFKIMFKLICS